MCVLFKDIGRRLPLELQQCSLYQGQQGDVNQSVHGNYKTRFRGTKSDSCGRKFLSLSSVPVGRITDEGRAEILRAWGPGFEQEGGREGGRGRGAAGRLNLCAETINPSRGQI